MSFLDKTGLTTLWSKIKDLASKYLPLDGGTIMGFLTVDGTLTTSSSIYMTMEDGSVCCLNVEKCKELGILTEMYDNNEVNT